MKFVKQSNAEYLCVIDHELRALYIQLDFGLIYLADYIRDKPSNIYIII